MAVIVNGDGILTGISSLATALTDLTSGRGTVTGVATVGTLQLGTGVSMSSPRSQQAAIFTNNTEFFTVDDAGRVGVGTVTPNSDAHPQNVGKINVGFITARSIAGDIDANTMVVAGISTFVGNLNIADSIIHIGDTDTKIRFSGADTISFDTGGTTRVNITSSGNLQMPNDNDYLQIGAGQDLALVHNGSSSFITNTTGFLEIQSDGITFEAANGTERVRIDTSGRLRIASTAETADAAFDDLIIGNHSGNRGISILSGATNQGALGFGKSGTVADGYVAYNHNSTATDSSMILKSQGKIQFNAGSSEKLRISDRGDLYLNESSSISSPYSTFNTFSIGNNLILSGYTGGNGGFAGMQQNAYVNSSGSWTKLYDDYAFSIGGDDGAIFFRTAGTGTGSITWSTPFKITNGGVVMIGGDTANSGDIDYSNTKLTIKQSGGGIEDGIYIERTGERRGYYIYVGGALGQNDALGIVSQQLGGDTAVLSIDRGGDIVVGAGNIKMNTSGKGIDFSTGAGGNSTSNLLDEYEEGTFSGTASATGYSGGSAIALLDEQYTKIGRTVHFNCRLQVASNLSDGDLSLSGLPFSASQDSVVDFSWQDAAGFNGGQGKISGTTCVRFNGNFPTHSSGTANIIFSGTYITAA